MISCLIRQLGGAVASDEPAEYREFAASDLDWTLVRARAPSSASTGRVFHEAHTPTVSVDVCDH